jgi:hypothetical protein
MTSIRKIKLQVKAVPPRNPLVAPALKRKAGAHQRSRGGARQAAERDTERAVREALKGG